MITREKVSLHGYFGTMHKMKQSSFFLFCLAMFFNAVAPEIGAIFFIMLAFSLASQFILFSTFGASLHEWHKKKTTWWMWPIELLVVYYAKKPFEYSEDCDQLVKNALENNEIQGIADNITETSHNTYAAVGIQGYEILADVSAYPAIYGIFYREETGTWYGRPSVINIIRLKNHIIDHYYESLT